MNVLQDAVVIKAAHVSARVRSDLACADQTVLVVLMEPVNVQKDVLVIKTASVHVQVKKDLACADQTVTVATI